VCRASGQVTGSARRTVTRDGFTVTRDGFTRLTGGQGACVCSWGYVGRACTFLCPGIIGNHAVCSGHGR
jgi:hypothetical protein